MMSTLCTNCPELSQTLLKNNIAETLGFLLTGSPSPELTQVKINIYYFIFIKVNFLLTSYNRNNNFF